MQNWLNNMNDHKLFPKILHGLYLLFAILSLLACLLALWVSGLELIERAQGHDTYLSQMYGLTAKQSIIYSIVYFVPFFTLLIFGIHNSIKKKRKTVLILSVIVWMVFWSQLFTDDLFLIHN